MSAADAMSAIVRFGRPGSNGEDATSHRRALPRALVRQLRAAAQHGYHLHLKAASSGKRGQIAGRPGPRRGRPKDGAAHAACDRAACDAHKRPDDAGAETHFACLPRRRVRCLCATPAETPAERVYRLQQAALVPRSAPGETRLAITGWTFQPQLRHRQTAHPPQVKPCMS